MMGYADKKQQDLVVCLTKGALKNENSLIRLYAHELGHHKNANLEKFLRKYLFREPLSFLTSISYLSTTVLYTANLFKCPSLEENMLLEFTNNLSLYLLPPLTILNGTVNRISEFMADKIAYNSTGLTIFDSGEKRPAFGLVGNTLILYQA